jgi:SepF-like predicted cell division protein (DUF552 family)
MTGEDGLHISPKQHSFKRPVQTLRRMNKEYGGQICFVCKLDVVV